VAASEGMLRRVGMAREGELLGKTDEDIHPARIARDIRVDDLRVIQTRQPLIDRVEALFIRTQAKDWYMTTKMPVFDPKGEVIGIMGYVRPCQPVGNTIPSWQRLERVVDYIHVNFRQSLAVDDLAEMACVSRRQLHRLFTQTFGMSPQTFIVRTRVQAASDDLVLTDKSISQIAAEHGFCDQSAFCKRFSEHTGETPLRFRQRHGKQRNMRSQRGSSAKGR
jgi:AraC-like DNA-binding protein